MTKSIPTFKLKEFSEFIQSEVVGFGEEGEPVKSRSTAQQGTVLVRRDSDFQEGQISSKLLQVALFKWTLIYKLRKIDEVA